jgi:predicted TIM-barrel fold metal-dependent hydrolase
MHDPINHPSHYADGTGIECIEAIEASMTMEEFKGFLKGNIEKYVWRYSKKRGSEDLKKAQWYLDRLIKIKEMEEAMVRATIAQSSKEVAEHIASYDPDDYLASGCPDGFCPMPNVRQGPPESMFQPV